jgi:hypothetical protein
MYEGAQPVGKGYGKKQGHLLSRLKWLVISNASMDADILVEKLIAEIGRLNIIRR